MDLVKLSNYRDLDKDSKADIDQNNYKLIFESAIMGIYHFDVINNKFLVVNPELARILGFEDANELMNEQNRLQLLNILNPTRIKILDLLDKADELYGYESQLIIDSKRIWISENIRAIKSKNKIIQIIGSVKDISEKKNLIERLQVTKDDWQRTFDAIEEVIIILDKELKIRRLNKAALKEYNTFTDNPEGVFCTNLYNIGESHCNTCPARATILDLQPHAREVEYESLGKTFLTSSLPIFDENEAFVGVVFIAKNITEEKKLRIESEKRLQQVIFADRLKSLGELVANVAHEINNPNNYVLQNTSLLKKSWNVFQPIIGDYLKNPNHDAFDVKYYSDLSSEMVELIDAINVGSKRINNVVQNLKGFIKPEVDSFSSLSVNEIIKSSLKIIQSKINKSFDTFTLDLGRNIPSIIGDLQKLEQVIINLVVNSIQARKNGIKRVLKITSRYVERLNAIYIEIYDNGQGIANDIIPKLFQPFFTTRGHEGGTGLGLSISYEIIKKHNGIIDVHSICSVGTKFKIYIPVEKSELGFLSSRMLCIDNDDSIFKKDIICFLGESRQTMKRLSGTKKLCEYLKVHPEIDILLLNASIINNIHKVVIELQEINPLFELIIFKAKNSTQLKR
ncbi:MAG: PAS domain S-box protein, partial [Arcobacter sp.]|nr:PAS domain S-box protein [Arcobacter sp.]